MGTPKILETVSIWGDEYYTLESDAEIIADNLINIPLKVWCPFKDTKSVWGDVLRKRGFDVVCTDTDFFTTLPPDGVQCIISNPPFSIKKEIMDRIRDLDLRFALILPFLWMNDGVPFDYGHQLLMFRKRMHFNTPRGEFEKPRVNCFVLSDGLLKQDFKVERRR